MVLIHDEVAKYTPLPQSLALQHVPLASQMNCLADSYQLKVAKGARTKV